MAAGRGRLSSIDLIPEDGQDDIVWAMGQLNQRKRTQADILFELNDRLAVKGIEPISKSAFNRKSIQVYAASQRIAEQRALFAGIADQFTPETVDETNMVLGEFIKVLITEILTASEGRISPKGAMELAQGYRAVISAQKTSSEHRARLVKDFEQKAEQAVEAVGRAKGLTPETISALRSEILGIRKEA